MIQNTLFSIIIPTFNSSKTLKSCLDSVFEQTFQSFEIVIIDGLSADETLQIIREYSLKFANIKVFSEKDNGIYDAMNKGLARAIGEWIFFLGSDDTFYNSTILLKISDLARSTPKKVIYGNVEIVGNTTWAKQGDIYAGKFNLQKILNQNICHQSIFYNREFVLNSIGNYNLNYIKSADWDYNLKCWAIMEFEFIDLIIAKYSVAGFSGNIGDVNLSNDFVKNALSYFKLSLFNPLINTEKFVFFNDVINLQKKNHYLRYNVETFKRFCIKVLNKIA